MGNPEDIAIIGFGCRLPGGATSPSKLWELLHDPPDLSQKISPSRFNPDAFYHQNGSHHGTTNVMNAYLLDEDHRHFDAQFFQIKPLEAETMDPQQRILLETVYEAVESAGLKLRDMQGTDTAIYVGAMGGDYNELALKGVNTIPTYLSTGTARSILSNRISYFFDWRGPSLTIDTACSSSLVALHEAVQVLRQGTSRIAVAAGVNLILGPETFIAESNLNMLSPTGHSRMWDASADGYARGDGFVAVILKRLEDALNDGDNIESVIRATGVNQDGRTKGITSPSSTSQMSLIQQVYRSAGLDPHSETGRCQYFEAHGTGTPAGDPVEAAAIAGAFFDDKDEASLNINPIFVGSIKTVIGHTEGTAGLAGVLKASLAVKYGTIPPNLHFNQLSPAVKPYYQRLVVPTVITRWPKLPEHIPRRASINSFGFGGTNAHVILESFPIDPISLGSTVNTIRCPLPYTFSATSEESLKRSIGTYMEYLKNTDSVNLHDFAFTLACRRSSFPYKASAIGFSKESLLLNMSEMVKKEKISTNQAADARPYGILAIFTGQGAQWAGMGRDLILSSYFVSKIVDELERYLRNLPVLERPTWSLREELLADASSSRLDEAELAQPLCTAIQIILVDLLRAAKVRLAAVVGHSSGEIAAAYAAGYLSRRDALYISYFRGFHAGISGGPNGERGAMLVVATTADDARDLCAYPELQGRVSVAAVNSASNVTLSGDEDAILKAKYAFEDEGKFVRLLEVDKAYHSHHMNACSANYLASLRACNINVQCCRDGGTAWFSSVYGSIVPHDCPELRDTYWQKNMVQPVLFSQAVAVASSAVASLPITIEVGPHPALKRPTLQSVTTPGTDQMPYLGMLKRNRNGFETVSELFGAIWSKLGENAIDLSSLFQLSPCKPRLLKGLPTYPWIHDRIYWHESQTSRAFRTRLHKPHELLGMMLPDGTTQELRWRNVLSLEELPWIRGHQLQGTTFFPAAGYVVMALEAAKFITNTPPAQTVEVRDLNIDRPITFDYQASTVEIMFTLTDISMDMKFPGCISAAFKCFVVQAKESASMIMTARGTLRMHLGELTSFALPPRTPEPPYLTSVDTDRLYSFFSEIGYGYTGLFRGLSDIRRKFGTVRGFIANPLSSDESRSSFLIHPATIDLAMQAVLVAYSWPGDGMLSCLHVPIRIACVRVNAQLVQRTSEHVKSLPFDCHLASRPGSSVCGDIEIFSIDSPSRSNNAIIQIEGVHTIPVSAPSAADDRIVFEDVVWGLAAPNASRITYSDSHSGLASLAGKVTFRYPHLRVLEVSDSRGQLTKRVLDEIGMFYDSYTITLPSPPLDDIESKIAASHPRVVTRKLDIHSELISEGISKHTYGMAIVDGLGLTTAGIELAARNLHLLLQPGGHLLMTQPTQPLGPHLLSKDVSESLITINQLRSILQRAGFGDVDNVTHSQGVVLLATQALDYRIAALRNPLQSTWLMFKPHRIFIIGNITSSTTTLVQGLQKILLQYFYDVIFVDSIENPAIVDIPSDATIISLSDLENPLFHDITPRMLEGLKTLLDGSRTILWVTRDCLSENPYANIIVGFGRTLLLERPDLCLQFLDVNSNLNVTAEMLAESVLTLRGAVEWSKRENANEPSILWTIEPELALDSDGSLMIPRVIPCQDRNDRYNSRHRKVTKELYTNECIVEVRYQESTSLYGLLERYTYTHTQFSCTPNNLEINVRFSSLMAHEVQGVGYLHVIFGEARDTGQTVLAFSETQSSRAIVPQRWCIPSRSDISQQDELAFFSAVIFNLWARAILSPLGRGDVALAYEPPRELAPALIKIAEAKSVQMHFATASFTNISSDEKQFPWLSVHPNSSSRLIASRLPQGVSVFIANSQIAGDIQSRISSHLPKLHRQLDIANTLSRTTILETSFHQSSDLRKQLRLASISAEPTAGDSCKTYDVRNLSEASLPPEMALVSWETSKIVTSMLEPVGSNISFSGWKTYFLVGLAGDLGRSLAEWMVDHGARFLVLTSRNPRIDKRWLKSFERMGAVIKIFPCDVASKDQMKKVIEEVEATLPPIAGVANGAMVLKDTPVTTMNIDSLGKVLRPKIQGSINLDEIFGNTNLDFFILFSSIAAVVGNKGQSNYSAANAFMCSLAARRRRRGLAASIIHLGAIVGTGYLTREVNQNMQDYLQKAGYLWMSEDDFHQVFAEGVLASAPTSCRNYEVMSGLRVSKSNQEDLVWFKNPKFQHCVLHRCDPAASRDNSYNNRPLKAQLEAASDVAETRRLVSNAFAGKLQEILLISMQPRIFELTADELGIDSLVATTIRTWFSKELAIDIPVMKILTSATIGDILDYAIERLPTGLLPTRVKVVEAPADEVGSKRDEHIHIPIVKEATPLHSEVHAGVLSSAVSMTPELANGPPQIALYPLSFPQLRFWFLQFLLEDKTTSNVSCLLSLKGPLFIHRLQQAVASVAKRHEGLRTCIIQKDGKSWQGVLKESSLRLEVKTIANETEVTKEFQRSKSHAFNLESGDTMRILLLAMAPELHYLIISYHHINMDGMSFMVLVKDLAKSYDGEELSQPLLQYPSFSERQHQDFDRGKFQLQIEYWKREFSEIPPPLPLLSLSRITTRKSMIRYESHMAKTKVDKPLREHIRTTCREQKVTAFHFFVTIFRAVLARFSGAEDICIGIADAGRRDSEAFQSIGNFLNLIPVRLRSPMQSTFAESLAETSAKTYAALSNADVPIDILFTELGIKRDSRQTPLFQAFVDYRNVQEKQKFGNCEIEGKEYSVGRTGYDISLDIIDDTTGDCTVVMMVQSSIYTDHDAKLLLTAVMKLAAACSENPSVTLQQPYLYEREEITDHLGLGRGPLLESKWQSLPQALNAISQQHPSSIALKDDHGTMLSYREMVTTVNNIASALLETMNGSIKPKFRVAVFQLPSVYWVCSMVAIMQTGAAYVPLDTLSGYPRCATILRESRASIILAHSGTMGHISQLNPRAGITIINIDALHHISTALGVSNRATPESIAAIIFTSGSTGDPKGVALTHHALHSHMEGTIKLWGFQNEIVLQQSARSFDASIFQVYLALLTGGTCYVISSENRGDPWAISKIMIEERITVTVGVPSEYLTWLRYGDHGVLKNSAYKIMVSVGEPFNTMLTRELQLLGKEDLRAVNMYGPSEVTFASNAMEVLYRNDAELLQSPAPAGYTLPNYSVYILNNDLEPVPPGVPGQIVVAGAISSGYIDDESLSSQRFIPNPFVQQEWNAERWNTIHLTGDWGRFHPSSGALIFEGRIEEDTQIKLRGIRIELRDIESTIIASANGDIAEVVVSAREDPTEFLVAHVVFSVKHRGTNTNELEPYLHRLIQNLPLPHYMRPTRTAVLDTMPLTVSGKVDRRAIGRLPLAESQSGRKGTMSKLGASEAKIKQLWHSVLSSRYSSTLLIDAQSDFFKIGGDSLLLVKLHHEIREAFGVTISLFQLFEGTSLVEMAETVDNAMSNKLPVRHGIDWDIETRIDALQYIYSPATLELSGSSSAQSTACGSNVVLTGATGFLGRNILTSLVKNPTIGRINCIAVRRPERIQAFANNRVRIYAGDLCDPCLGLSPSEAEYIFRNTDIIIHNGADVTYLKNYASLRSSNLGSTKELCRMLLSYRGINPSAQPPLIFHYISTVGVAQLNPGISEFRPVSVSSFPPPLDGTDGYAASKWASEVFLERLVQH
ncbi:hypothetical protein F4776DRAFT_669752, partial [Hypoxylon sp. NC0597]